ncbi:non-ribosomal peptide synthase domain TIGR01720/amino acid adenylation domain-containing protein [Clostridium cavendishii DSM 21758]|uniref:Non-ribosomal peptide synthase domain TIGR01720/amino acid adenylation domain-containing protein n=1 Tax=Clostridium cavendishii DSM 21758 TaxID=1121302 RepID=A0A1M6NTE2_9CLOT|nr:non-ribosomal peptide synthetase [Clostridium cavendishii]SHJ98997.1 non-ribosomal peptide synthase domain TIGR01720/amino acid adenylation domain-containing protein [Clostridium cavendishii DSM 21758]
METNKVKYYELTHPQKRVWYIEKINDNSQLHNIGGYLKINGSIDFEILEKAIQILIKRNSGIRINIVEKNGKPYQYIKPYKDQKVDFFDFSDQDKAKLKFEKWVKNVFEKPFRLNGNNLYYFAMYRISKQECGILLNINHIVADGWAISIIQKEICEIYKALINCEDILNSKKYSYIDYVEKEKKYLGSSRFLRNKSFWNEKFSSLQEESLYKSSTKVQGDRKNFVINSGITKKMRSFLNERKVSMNTFFVAAMAIYLNKTTEKKEIVIGNPVFNRLDRNDRNTVGMYTSTMPVKLVIDNNSSIEELLSYVSSELKLCFLNQKYPYDLLIKDLELTKKGYDSLFKMSLNYYNGTFINDINGIPVEVKEYYNGNQNYSIQLVVKEFENDNIVLSIDYKVDEYSEEEISYIYKYYMNIINQIINNKNVKVKDINLYDELEYFNKINKFNLTKTIYPRNKTIYRLIQEQVEKTPNNVAIIFNNEKLTYKELNEKANQVAWGLHKYGIFKGNVVAIIANHSVELIIFILAVLKTGATYLPIEPKYPIDRINYMLNDSNAKLVLTNLESEIQYDFKGEVYNLKCHLFCNDRISNLNIEEDVNSLAYIIYTSGSTGKPKGVMIKHKNLVNYIYWANKMYIKDDNEVFALYSSISFDLTITSIFTPLISGHSIIIYEGSEDEFVLYRILEENKVTIIKLTPSHLTLIKDIDNTNSRVKRFIVGGEVLKRNLCKAIQKSFNNKIEIINEYGPTEATVGCMIYKYDEKDNKGSTVPIGSPIDNTQIYILNKQLSLVSTGIVGEIYISGDGVATGYLNKDELSQEKFINNPFISGKKMYKTGDLAKYLNDECIEYVGRIDNQVKIRGHRIELEEIEKALLEHNLIKNVIVIERKDNNDNKLLFAYIISEKEIPYKELKAWLSNYVPEYMLPNRFIYVKEFPLTSNGKINYNMLPMDNIVEKEVIPFKNEYEKQLISSMKEVLGISHISIKDNFYQLGGDSIKAIQLSSKLKNKGLDIKVKDILSKDNVYEIASTIKNNNKMLVYDQKLSEGNIRKTPVIEWFFSQEFNEKNHYNQSVMIESLNTNKLDNIEKAIKKIVEHHDVLRLGYNKNTNQLFYKNENVGKKVGVNIYDLTDIDENKRNQKLIELGYLQKSSLNFEKDYLFKVSIFDIENKKQLILLTAHHLLVDGVSWRILVEDFINCLISFESNSRLILPSKTSSYQEWADKLYEYSKNDFYEEKIYWNKILEKKISFPIDFDKGIDSIRTSQTVDIVIDSQLTKEVIKQAYDIYGIDVNEILIIMLAITINNISNEREMLIELERHGREIIDDSIDISRTVGWFTSMYPLYLYIENEELNYKIKNLKEQIRVVPKKGFNYSIIKYLKKEFNNTNLKLVRFNYLGDFDNILKNNKFTISFINSGQDIGPNNHLTSLLDINSLILNEKLNINITYSKNKFKEKTIKDFADKYVKNIEEFVEYCKKRDCKEFTPSDFDGVDISQDDLDNLFD